MKLITGSLRDRIKDQKELITDQKKLIDLLKANLFIAEGYKDLYEFYYNLHVIKEEQKK